MPVTVLQIDSLLQGRDTLPPDVLKIDVEGTGLDVLTGAVEILRISQLTIAGQNL